MAKTERLRRSFFPQAIRLLTQSHNIITSTGLNLINCKHTHYSPSSTLLLCVHTRYNLFAHSLAHSCFLFFINIYYSQYTVLHILSHCTSYYFYFYYLFPFSFSPIFIYIFSCVYVSLFLLLMFFFFFFLSYYTPRCTEKPVSSMAESGTIADIHVSVMQITQQLVYQHIAVGMRCAPAVRRVCYPVTER